MSLEGPLADDTETVDLSEFLEGVVTASRCTLCDLLPKLPDDRRTKLELALRTERISGERIYRIVNNSWGHGVGLGTVRRHRKEHLVAD